MLGLMTWRTASWVIGRARRDREKRWAADLAAMIQVSLVGYASAGAFLGLAYFDFYYTLIAIVVLCKTLLIADSAARVARPAAWAAAPSLSKQPTAAPQSASVRSLGPVDGVGEQRG